MAARPLDESDEKGDLAPLRTGVIPPAVVRDRTGGETGERLGAPTVCHWARSLDIVRQLPAQRALFHPEHFDEGHDYQERREQAKREPQRRPTSVPDACHDRHDEGDERRGQPGDERKPGELPGEGV